jgi:hypothetical protein
MNAFLDAVAEGFVENGHAIAVAHLDDLSRPVTDADLIVSMGGVGADLDLEAPVLTWLVDNPVWTPELYGMRADRDGVLVVAGEHIRVATEFLGLDMPVGFAPHGIEIDPALPAPSFADDERDIDVLFPASFAPRQQPEWHTDEPRVADALRTTLKLADERWDHHVRELEVATLFREAAESHGLPFVVEGHRMFAPQLAWLDGHLRDRRRLACVRALDRAGIGVHLVGAGWDRLAHLEHAVIHPPTDHTALFALARRSKVVANIGPPLFNQGWHERIPLAMATGALAVTETNDWLAADLDVAKLFDAYSMPSLEELPDVVRRAMNDPARHDRTREAYTLVREAHTWQARARTILDMVEV